jgi:outer membrane protein assembly factor BamB
VLPVLAIFAAVSLLGLNGPAAPAAATGAGRPSGVAPGDAARDWTTWGYDVQRTGFNPNETTLGTGTVHGLHLLWSFPFALKSDNAPVLATDVLVDDVPTNLIYAGDRTGTFYAVNADTGAPVWSRQLGTNQTCAGVLGVTDTAVIDRSRGLLFVAGGDGQLYALDLATGETAAGWPLPITMFPNEYVWSAITQFGGSLYVAVASGCDGLGTNYGRVVRVDPDTITQTAAFYVTDGPNTGVSGGGIWGWGGVSIDPADGNAYEVSANGYPDEQYEHFLYAESLVRLGGDFSVVASNYPGLEGRDVDFGSTPVLFDGPHGCGPQVAAEAKTGELFLWNRDDINAGPVDRVLLSGANLIGVPAWDPVHRLLFVGNSADSADATYQSGLLAFRIGRDCTLQLAWQRPGGGGVTGSPVIANGVVYFGDGSGHKLLAVNAKTHKKLWTSRQLFTTSLQTEPIVAGGRVYVTTGLGLYAFGL